MLGCRYSVYFPPGAVSLNVKMKCSMDRWSIALNKKKIIILHHNYDFFWNTKGAKFYNSKSVFVFIKVFLFCSKTSSLLNPSATALLSSSSLNVTQWLKSFGLGLFKFSEVCAGEVVDGACMERGKEECMSRSRRLVFSVRELVSSRCGCWPAGTEGPWSFAISSAALGAKGWVVLVSGPAEAVGPKWAGPWVWGQDPGLLLLELSSDPLKRGLSLLWRTWRWKAAGADFFLRGGTFGAKGVFWGGSTTASAVLADRGCLSLLPLLSCSFPACVLGLGTGVILVGLRIAPASRGSSKPKGDCAVCWSNCSSGAMAWGGNGRRNVRTKRDLKLWVTTGASVIDSVTKKSWQSWKEKKAVQRAGLTAQFSTVPAGLWTHALCLAVTFRELWSTRTLQPDHSQLFLIISLFRLGFCSGPN